MMTSSFRTLKLALAQANPVMGDISGNLDKARLARAEAARLGADLLVLPELYIVGYTPGGAPYGITGRNGSRWMTLRLRKTKRRKMLAVPRRDHSWPYGKCRSDLTNVELHWMPG